jgi:hydrogenase nickel incorporation protein HypA/HybF
MGGRLMHERGAVSEAAAAFLGQIGDQTVGQVVLVTGPTVVVEVAADTWSHVTEGTPVEGASVVWESALDRLECFACATEYEGTKLTQCPSCGASGLVVEAAPDFAVRTWSADVSR